MTSRMPAVLKIDDVTSGVKFFRSYQHIAWSPVSYDLFCYRSFANPMSHKYRLTQ